MVNLSNQNIHKQVIEDIIGDSKQLSIKHVEVLFHKYGLEKPPNTIMTNINKFYNNNLNKENVIKINSSMQYDKNLINSFIMKNYYTKNKLDPNKVYQDLIKIDKNIKLNNIEQYIKNIKNPDQYFINLLENE